MPPRVTQTTLLAAALATIGPAHAQETLTWKSTAGSTVEAKLVGIEGDTVTLQLADGRQLTLAKSKLAPESLAQLEPAAHAEAQENPGWLPTFKSGSLKNYFGSYHHTHFDAYLTKKGMVQIYFNDNDGKRASDKYLLVRPGLGFFTGGEWLSRAISSAQTDAEPTDALRELTVSGTAQDGVEWEFTYAFEDHTLTIYGKAEDPDDITHPTLCQVVSSLPRFDALDYTVPEDELIEVVGESTLVVQKDRGDDLTFNFHERYKLGQAVREAEGENPSAHVRSTHTGPRTVRWLPADTDHGTLNFANSGTSALFEGFLVYYRNKDAGRTGKDTAITIAVE